jgi:predicted  nucleic acid-binding Zn-ribbon protein
MRDQKEAFNQYREERKANEEILRAQLLEARKERTTAQQEKSREKARVEFLDQRTTMLERQAETERKEAERLRTRTAELAGQVTDQQQALAGERERLRTAEAERSNFSERCAVLSGKVEV